MTNELLSPEEKSAVIAAIKCDIPIGIVYARYVQMRDSRMVINKGICEAIMLGYIQINGMRDDELIFSLTEKGKINSSGIMGYN